MINGINFKQDFVKYFDYEIKNNSILLKKINLFNFLKDLNLDPSTFYLLEMYLKNNSDFNNWHNFEVFNPPLKITIEESMALNLKKNLKNFLSKELKEQVQIIVMQEYGQLLPQWNEIEWSFGQVFLKDIKNDDWKYQKTLNDDKIKEYKTFFLENPNYIFGGIVLKKPSEYILIDGQHKIKALRDLGSKDNSVLCLIGK